MRSPLADVMMPTPDFPTLTFEIISVIAPREISTVTHPIFLPPTTIGVEQEDITVADVGS